MPWGTKKLDLKLVRNTDVDVSITLTNRATGQPIPLSAYTALLAVRNPSDTLLFDMSSTDGDIALDDLGHIVMHFKAAKTKNVIPYETSKQLNRWDIQLTTSAGAVERPFRGTFDVLIDVARTE